MRSIVRRIRTRDQMEDAVAIEPGHGGSGRAAWLRMERIMQALAAFTSPIEMLLDVLPLRGQAKEFTIRIGCQKRHRCS